MKKLISLGVVTLAILSLSACSNRSDSSSNSSKPDNQTNQSSRKEKVDKFKNQAEVGEAIFNIGTPAGNTANGEKAELFYKSELVVQQIGYSAEKFSGKKKTFVYVDGVKDSEGQWSELKTVGSVNLRKDRGDLEKGTHKVEAVQYDTDTEDGKITTFKVREYTIK